MKLFRRRHNVKRSTLEAARTERRRAIYLMLRKIMWASVVMLIVSVGVETHRFLTTTELLALRNIEITGNEKATAWELRTLGGVELERNILSLDLEGMVKKLRSHPWVQNVRLRRMLPDRLLIEVWEREPAALLAMGDLYYVDQHGVPFKKVRAGEQLDYPVLTGFEGPGPLQQGRIGRQAIREGLSLLELLGKDPRFTRDTISELHLDTVEGWSLYSAQSAAQIHLGWSPFEDKISRLHKLLDQERLNLAQVRRLDMNYARWAVVTPL